MTHNDKKIAQNGYKTNNHLDDLIECMVIWAFLFNKKEFMLQTICFVLSAYLTSTIWTLQSLSSICVIVIFMD